MKSFRLVFACVLILVSCAPNEGEADLESLKQEVYNAELAFTRMAQEEGIARAFVSFADENAVLKRNDILIEGRDAIEAYFSKQDLSGVSLIWKPDFIDVAASGDMAYTYGHFTLSQTDSMGTAQSVSGVFHTVWKRQEDGSWKYVWD